MVPELRIATDRRFELVISLAALVLLLLGCAVVLRPFVTSLLWAVVLWLTTAPIHQRVLALVGERRTAAAALMTLGMALVLLLPIVIVVFSLSDSATALAAASRRWLEGGPPQPPEWLDRLPLVGSYAAVRWAELAGDSHRVAAQLEDWIEPTASKLLSG